MRRMAKAARLVAVAVVVWVVLAIIGALMTPPWRLQPYDDHIALASAYTSIASSHSGSGTPIGTYQVRESTITIPLAAGVSVNAIVREPVGAQDGRPAMIMLHGAGTDDAGEAYGDLAPALASAGIVTMVPDKRLDNYSLMHRDYVAMAHDYEQEFDALRALPSVDPSKTGVYAESEGTWISAVMTAERPDIAFSVIAGAPVYSGRQMTAMAARTYFAMADVPDEVSDDIEKLSLLDFSLVRFNYADFNAMPYLDRLTQPTLVAYGTLDPSMPLEQGAKEIRDRAANGSGNRNVTLRYYPVNHQMRLGSMLPAPGQQLDPDYARDVAAWIQGVAAGTGADDWTTPMAAGVQPDQLFAVPATNGMASGALSIRSLTQLVVLMAGGLGLLMLAGLAGGIAAAIRWLRGRREDRHPRRPIGLAAPLWTLSGGAAAALAITIGYLGLVSMDAMRLTDNPALFDGGWIALRALGAALAMAWAWLLLRVWDALRTATASMTATTMVTATVAAMGAAMICAALAFWGLYAV